MLTLAVFSRPKANLYGLLIEKERDLRENNRGTLHRRGKRKAAEEKWVHNSYPGWISFRKSLGGVVVALIRSRTDQGEWQLLKSFIGFLFRHFRTEIESVNIGFANEEE